MVTQERQTNKIIVRMQLIKCSVVGEVASSNHLIAKKGAIHHNAILQSRLPHVQRSQKNPAHGDAELDRGQLLEISSNYLPSTYLCIPQPSISIVKSQNLRAASGDEVPQKEMRILRVR